MLNMLRRIATEKKAAADLYRAIVRRSREPVFYSGLGVPDTFDGRFDLAVLHTWMVLEALRQAEMNDLAERLIQEVFAGFEYGLRDQGAGDMGIGRRIKAMTSALFGRIQSYRAAADEKALAEALVRNLYRDAPNSEEHALAVARYIGDARKAVAGSALAEGAAEFGPLPHPLKATI
ncbi:MAG TPA: ubiquinol-cytochrome C chaperone family protein [Rhizomicrobium sp.]|jgi:cytochrome b pre-mRNA-processing protein 3